MPLGAGSFLADKQYNDVRLSGSERLMAALKTPAAKRIYTGLLVLLILFLWFNMVYRVVRPGSSHFESFRLFSEDLVYRRINIYLEYSILDTVTKYPPFFALLLAPLVPLPLWLGASIWFWVSFALAIGAAYFSVLTVQEGGELARDRSLLLIPLILAAGIIGSNLETAHINHVTLFLTCLSLYSFKQGKDVRAGALLGVAAALKITPGLFVLYFLYKRAFRVVVAAGIAVVVCWLVVPPFLFGFENFPPILLGWWDIFHRFVTEGIIAEGIVGFRHTNQSLAAALHRFLSEVPADGGKGPGYFINVLSLSIPWVDRLTKLLILGIFVFLAWICRTPASDRSSLALSFEYSLIFIATLFISPISWIDHYVYLLYPYTAAVYYVRTRPSVLYERRLMLYATIASFFLVSSSASTLMQAWSLPVVGALVLAIALALALRGEQMAPVQDGLIEAGV